MTRAVKRQLPLCLALLSALTFSQGQPPATPPIVSFAVTTGGVDEILWPALDLVSAFAVQSCPDATCATPSVVPGTPTSLCASCQEFVLSYTPPGRRRLHGIGSYYRVQWTPSSGGSVVYSAATAAQDGTGPTSGTSPVYADPNRGSTAAGCGSWASPCSQIANAISACPADGGTVWLTSGLFAGMGNTEVSFGGKIITVSSIYGSSYTVINGKNANRGFIFDTNEVGAILNGVTVLYGSAGATGSGAAILIDSAAPIISNCYFASGVAPAGDGGAIVITNSQGISTATDPAAVTTTVVGTTFINNTAQNGGGISVTGAAVVVSNSLFEYNFATQAGAGRGGAIVATFSGILLTNVVMANGFAVFSGGGVHFEAAITLGLCTGVQMISNAAASFGGAFTSFAGSTCYFTESEFSDNVSGFYGGGMLALYGNATVSYSKINRNRSTYGGGATKALAGSLFLDNCEVANNTANAGAGTEIAGATGYTSVVGISNTVISGNSAVLQGAAFNLGSTNGTTFTNVTFLNNVATSGGAGYCAGDVFPGAGSLVIQNSIFSGNDAELGGSIYATTGCIANIQTTTFSGNTAQQYGSAILTTASVSMAITTCSFIGNGNVAGSVPPSGGGAISIGYNQFIVDASSSQTELTNVSIHGSVFASNVATDRGGALNLQAGALTLSNSTFSGNSVTAPTIADVGTGGAVSVIDACLSGACQPAIANITNTNFTGNMAFQAGGALYYSAANTGSQLSYTGGTLAGNSVQYSLAERNKYGLGGAIYVSNKSYSLQSLSLSGNAAYFGGALFASCNFASGSALQSLAYGANTALLGTDQYWLRSASPSAVLTCSGCTHASSSSLATATEVVQLAFATPPPTAFQSSEPASTFVVSLQDYYGNPGLAEYSGTCQVTYSGTVLTLPELGRSVDIYNGTGTFQQLTVEGGIGSSFALQVLCAPGTDGQNPLLPTNISIPPITFDITVELCPQGSEERGILCQPCDLNFYNYNSTSCQACPEGAQCPGGSLGLDTPILTQAGYWRSSSTSPDLYRCKTTAACEGYPTASGEAYANEACPPGSVGPLCAVCAPGSFGFGDQCQTCTGSPQGKLMLAFVVLLFTALLVVLFVFDFGTDLKPGVMIKVKTLLTHFQLMSLLRTYDVTWPTATQQTLSWSDTLNVGLSVAAPGCWIPHYNFYVFYLIQMAMPIVLVLFCLGVFLGAVKACVQLETYLEDGVFTKELPEAQAQAWHKWLSALQTRCYKNAFWFVTLLYPRCAQTSMQMFATQTLDVGTFLKADYSISTRTPDGAISSTYAVYLVFGTVLVIVFTLVLPIFYFYVIWRLRFRLQEESVIQRYGFLYGGYSFPYWEVADMVRKLAIAAIPVFIKPQPTGSLQAVLGEVVMVIYIFVISYLKPFASPNDNLLQVGSMLVLFLLLLSGESLKWAKLSSTQEQYMSDAQVLLTTGVVVAVVLYGFLTLGFVRRGAKAAYWRMTGASNRVAPVGPEVSQASSSVDAAEKAPQAKAEERAWDASYNSSEEYTDDGGSSSYSSADGTRHSPRDGSLASQDEPIVDNPLVLAFSQQQSRKAGGHED